MTNSPTKDHFTAQMPRSEVALWRGLPRRGCVRAPVAVLVIFAMVCYEGAFTVDPVLFTHRRPVQRPAPEITHTCAATSRPSATSAMTHSGITGDWKPPSCLTAPALG